MTSKVIDYSTTYFEFPAIDNIHREPLYESLNILKFSLKQIPSHFPPIFDEENMDTPF